MLTIDPRRAGSIRRTAMAQPNITPCCSTRSPSVDVLGRDLVGAADDVDAGVVDPVTQLAAALRGVGGPLVRVPVTDVAGDRLELLAELRAGSFARRPG